MHPIVSLKQDFCWQKLKSLNVNSYIRFWNDIIDRIKYEMHIWKNQNQLIFHLSLLAPFVCYNGDKSFEKAFVL